MEEISQEALDSALILENKLKERVHKIVEMVVINIVGKAIHQAIADEKQTMMTEIVMTIGKAMGAADKDERKPLWESDPEDFGFTEKDMNSTGMTSVFNQTDLPVK